MYWTGKINKELSSIQEMEEDYPMLDIESFKIYAK